MFQNTNNQLFVLHLFGIYTVMFKNAKYNRLKFRKFFMLLSRFPILGILNFLIGTSTQWRSLDYERGRGGG